jgi:hypothetical protein
MLLFGIQSFEYKHTPESAIKEMAAKGLRTPIGDKTYSVDSFVSSDFMSALTDTTSKISLERAQEVGADLVITSEHAGARPTHAVWQGKVFSLKGKQGKYDDFYAATGFGKVDGLCGINCRHSYQPYFAEVGSSANTGTHVSQRLNAKIYDAEQKQRGIERQIRSWKRQETALKAGGYDSSYETSKVREYQQKMRDLIDNNDFLTRDYAREK